MGLLTDLLGDGNATSELAFMVPAAYGDGATDATAAIQAQIDAAGSGRGGVVYLPPGSYVTSSTLNVPSHVKLVGAGSTYRGTTVDAGATTIHYGGSGSAIKATGATNIAVKGLTIVATNPTGTSMRGIWLAGAWYFQLEDICVKGISDTYGYAILADVGASFGLYEGDIKRIDVGVGPTGGVIRLAGTGPANFVMTTTVSTAWASRYETTHGQVVFESCVPEGWTRTLEDDNVGGFTIDGSGTTTLVNCAMEGAEIADAKTRPAIYVRPTHTGRGVHQFGTRWEGHSGVRYVGTLTGAEGDAVSQPVFNKYLEFSQYPLSAGGRIPGLRFGQQRPNGLPDIASLEAIASAVGGGSQSGHLVERRRVVGALRDAIDHGLRWSVRNTKTVPNDETAVTFFTIGFGQYGFGSKLQAVASGVHSGVGAIGVFRDAVCATGPSQVGVALSAGTEQSIGSTNACHILYTVSGNDLLVQVTLSGGSASSVTLSLDSFGPLRSGVVAN